MTKLDTIIFDVSGVLIDDLYSVWKADSNAFEACGLGRIESVERFKEEFRFPISEFYRAMGVPENVTSKIEEEFRRAYPNYSGFIEVFPEVKSVLEKLKQEKMVLAVASNILSLFLIAHLKRFKIYKYFNVVTGQDDCDEKKPSPKPILITLEKLGSKPEQAAYVGDMEEDIVAGRRAGTYTIAICRNASYHPRWKLERQKPDFLISNLNELLPIVELLNSPSNEG